MFYNADQLLTLCINMGGNRYNKLLAVKSLSFTLNRKNVSIWTISIYKSSRLKHETRMDTNRLGCKNSSQLKTTQSCRYSLTESVLSNGSSLTVVMLAFNMLVLCIFLNRIPSLHFLFPKISVSIWLLYFLFAKVKPLLPTTKYFGAFFTLHKFFL